MLRESPGPLHVIQFTDEAFVPSAGVLLSQLERSAAANADIADDMTRGLLGGGGAPRPEDLIFAGAALSRLTQCPFFETHDLLTRQGLQTSPPIEAVVLSIHSEPVRLLRHRRLGYLTCWHGFRLSDAGPAVREWVEGSFEIVTRTLSDVQNDLMMLRKALAARGVRHMLILNAMSSTGHEDIFSYSAFQGPLGDVLGSVRAMETNLMLHDLAAASDIQIVDVDAIAAELGAGAHLPDGLHQSGRFQAAVRAEILHILDHRGLFKPADVDSPDDR